MNSKLGNLALFVLGLAAYFLLINSAEWTIAGHIGIFVSAVTLYHFVGPVFPRQGSPADWFTALLLMVTFGILLSLLRAGSFLIFGTLLYFVAEAVLLLLALVCAIRLYLFLLRLFDRAWDKA